MHRRHQLVLHTISQLTDCLRRHETIYRGVPGFTEQVEIFRRLATEAETQAERCLDSSPDLPTNLREIRETLIQTVCAVSGPLAGWAAIIGDESLRSQFSSTPQELRAMGAGLGDHARAIAAIGRCTLGQGAGHYGLTEIALERLHQETLRFEETLERCPEAFHSLRSAAEELHVFLRDVMDPLVRGFLLSAPGFCAAYRHARKTKNTGLNNRTSAPALGAETMLHA
jgi:hypothetical protein